MIWLGSEMAEHEAELQSSSSSSVAAAAAADEDEDDDDDRDDDDGGSGSPGVFTRSIAARREFLLLAVDGFVNLALAGNVAARLFFVDNDGLLPVLKMESSALKPLLLLFFPTSCSSFIIGGFPEYISRFLGRARQDRAGQDRTGQPDTNPRRPN